MSDEDDMINSQVLEQDDSIEEQILSGDEQVAVFGRRNAAAKIRFRDWARQTQPWLKLCIDYAVRGTVMFGILSTIKAPISQVTV